ncbi:hypothetical protein G7Y89_g11012 [Cudoniella acicularis]|uniref:Superoxide dismutase [Mn], mitochondrial n=1 Tax=Cudoniella acicularis TaxID=354080 RepID=A0A8H4RCR0_9HELO|nr:hypothetical protein G7Y89_g11012 [Cudoniella acicularis]
MASAKYTLPALPYAHDALEPHISDQIMTLHHTKHHQAYVNNLNAALSSQATVSSTNNIVGQLHLQNAINFNAGGHINHTLFWENLIPASSPSAQVTTAPKLMAALTSRWGSLEKFQEKFNTVLLGLKGSGWGWLVQDTESGILDIITSKDQDIVPAGKKPLLGIDMWEHAYYLQYLNDKASYAKGIWKVVNWAKVEERFEGSFEATFGNLAGLRGNLGGFSYLFFAVPNENEIPLGPGMVEDHQHAALVESQCNERFERDLKAQADKYNRVKHLAGVTPPFDPLDPLLDPAPPQGCNVARAAYLIRHAAIFANDFDYESYIEPFVQKLSNTAVDWSKVPVLSFLATWQNPITDAEQEMLTRSGKLEATKLGVDVAQRYQGLRTPKNIWTSTAERTVKSAKSFSTGIAGVASDIDIVQISEGEKEGANSLTPYEGCPAYSSSAGSKQATELLNIYTKPVTARFNTAAPAFNFTATDIYAMSLLCGYETVIRGSFSFCSLSVLSPNEWLAFEYTNDLIYHYNTGYGSPVSRAIGSPG